MNVLILCTGNSCRSKMAHGFLKSFNKELKVFSAGTYPSGKVNGKAVTAMRETGIDISSHYPKSVETYTVFSSIQARDDLERPRLNPSSMKLFVS